MIAVVAIVMTAGTATADWTQTIGELTALNYVLPMTADLDDDGPREIAILVKDEYIELVILESDGSLRARTSTGHYCSHRSYVAVGDVDGDSETELVTICHNPDRALIIFDRNGALEHEISIPSYMSNEIQHSPMLADLDGDCVPEVLYAGWMDYSAWLMALRGDGTNFPGFPVQLEQGQHNVLAVAGSSPSAGYINDDGQLDLVIVSRTIEIASGGEKHAYANAITSDGELIWRLEIPAWSGRSAVGDIDNDGTDEVVIVSVSGVHIIDDGAFTVDHQLGSDGSNYGPSLADLDGDGDLEIVFSYSGRVYAMHHDGSFLFTYNAGIWLENAVIGDIDSDGSPDIVFINEYSLYALDATGSVKPGFPLSTGHRMTGGPVIDDLDQDGKVELIACSGISETMTAVVSSWELAGDYDPALMPWPGFRRDAQHTAYYPGLQCGLDFGDAPEPGFPTRLASDGASHILGGGVYLGACVDAEADGLADAAASGDDLGTGRLISGTCSGDDDEDGVVFTGAVLPGSDAEVEVTASAACTLSAWLDADGDGTWSESEALLPGGQDLVAGVNSLALPIPPSAVAGPSFARFRCTSHGVVAATGRAADGEVEDYPVTIAGSPALAVAVTPSLLDLGGGSYRISYTITLSNLGDVPLLGLQASDSLVAAFFGADGYSGISVTGDGLTVNPSYDGGNDHALLAGTDALAVAGSAVIELGVTLSSPRYDGPFTNSVEVTASGAGSPIMASGAATISLAQAQIPTLGIPGAAILVLLLVAVAVYRIRYLG
jgi:hypothetical protein